MKGKKRISDESLPPSFVCEDGLDLSYQWATIMEHARQVRGLTQTELSKRTGISQGEISHFENGFGNPSLKTLGRISDGLGMRLKLELIPIKETEISDTTDE